MTRERLVGAALRAWPPAVRAQRGPEIASTLLEASDSRTRFARELAVLAWRGLGARLAAGGAVRAVLLGGVRLAGGALVVLWLAADVHVAHFAVRTTRFDGELVLLVASCALAVAGRDRWAGGGLLGATLWQVGATPTIGTYWILATFPLACAVAMIVAPGPARARRELLLGAVVLIPLAAVNQPAPLEAGVAILGLASLLTLAGDPRPAVACALVALWVGVTMARWGTDPRIAAALLALALLTLLAATLRARAPQALSRSEARSRGRRR